MKVAIVAPPWVAVPPPTYGGTELVLDQLARGLQDAGVQVRLITTSDSTCPVPKICPLPSAVGIPEATPMVELFHVVTGYQQLQDWNPNIVHDHTVFGPIFARGLSVPTITTNHGVFNDTARVIYREISRYVPIIAISKHHASTARGIPIRAMIYHGIDVASFPFGTGRGGYALFLGRISEQKGVHTAIRVSKAAGIPLKIAAKMTSPEEKTYFHDWVEPFLDDDVQYVGEVGLAAKQVLLANAICLLNPIQWPEPFGLVMIEALACGTPVVATPHGSVPELIEDGATGFIRTSEDELINVLARVGELDRSYCRQVAQERFSTKRMVQEHLRLYQQILDDQPTEKVA